MGTEFVHGPEMSEKEMLSAMVHRIAKIVNTGLGATVVSGIHLRLDISGLPNAVKAIVEERDALAKQVEALQAAKDVATRDRPKLEALRALYESHTHGVTEGERKLLNAIEEAGR